MNDSTKKPLEKSNDVALTRESSALARKLRNIGPAMAKKMIIAGIDSPEVLESLGAQKAYLKMYEHGDNYGDHNAAYLLALEGAIRNCDWSQLPTAVKKKHTSFAKKLQSSKGE